jgi:putative Mg2+ transporter-C (MgtC) family protein
MPLILEWHDIALRLALTILAGALVGFNRSEHGRPAGLRTTLLVCLAASIAMIQTNLLLITAGKAPDSFVTLDLMRLPLGILTGMGFIGAGAILRRGELVRGITTAATLWLVTVIGLCFGGGQIGLGVAALALAMIVLKGLKALESRMRQDRRAKLILSSGEGGPTEEEIRATLLAAGYHIMSWAVSYNASGSLPHRTTVRCEVQWRGCQTDTQPPPFVHHYCQHPGVLKLRWKV